MAKANAPTSNKEVSCTAENTANAMAAANASTSNKEVIQVSCTAENTSNTIAAANASTSNEEVIKFVPGGNDNFRSNSPITFTVRKMPPVSSSGGSIVIQDSEGSAKFIFEGSALKDSDGNLILTVKPKEGIMANLLGIMANLLGIMQNLPGQKQWEASLKDHSELLFTLKYSGPKNSIKVSLTNSKRCDYEIEKGSLEKDNFTISDMSGGIRRIAAEVNRNYFLGDIKIKSTYDVEVEPGYDQAFIFGLVAVLEQLPH
uniref:Tubby C-terminal domain-containing protein n=1 Tax=Picea sitchensis TaxID=3332 RepID=D5AA76_PICSI|nr:unknown [Picea sitchensis]